MERFRSPRRRHAPVPPAGGWFVSPSVGSEHELTNEDESIMALLEEPSKGPFQNAAANQQTSKSHADSRAVVRSSSTTLSSAIAQKRWHQKPLKMAPEAVVALAAANSRIAQLEVIYSQPLKRPKRCTYSHTHYHLYLCLSL